MGCRTSKTKASLAVQEPLPPPKKALDRDRLAQLQQSLDQACAGANSDVGNTVGDKSISDRGPHDVVKASQVPRLLCETPQEKPRSSTISTAIAGAVGSTHKEKGDQRSDSLREGPEDKAVVGAADKAQSAALHEEIPAGPSWASNMLMAAVGSSVAPSASLARATGSDAPTAPLVPPSPAGEPSGGVLATWLPMFASIAPASSRCPSSASGAPGHGGVVALGESSQPALLVKEINPNAWWRGVGVPVWLHIYDVSEGTLTWINNLIRPVGSGAFHAAVEVFDKEWSFGYSPGGNSGVYSCVPRCNSSHTYRESVLMGWTPLGSDRVDRLVEDLAKKWPGLCYSVLEKNCCHFCDDMCRALGVGPTPEWVTNLAGAGASVVEHVGRAAVNSQVAAGLAVAKATQYAEAAATLAGQKADELEERYKISEFLSQELDEGKVREAAHRFWNRTSIVGACTKKPCGAIDRLEPLEAAPSSGLEHITTLEESVVDVQRRIKFEKASIPLVIDCADDFVPISECEAQANSGTSTGSGASSGSCESVTSARVVEENLNSAAAEHTGSHYIEAAGQPSVSSPSTVEAAAQARSVAEVLEVAQPAEEGGGDAPTLDAAAPEIADLASGSGEEDVLLQSEEPIPHPREDPSPACNKQAADITAPAVEPQASATQAFEEPEWVTGERAQFFSSRDNSWDTECVVQNVFHEDDVFEGYAVSPGMLKVAFADGRAKFVFKEQQAKLLKKLDEEEASCHFGTTDDMTDTPPPLADHKFHPDRSPHSIASASDGISKSPEFAVSANPPCDSLQANQDEIEILS